MITQLTDPPKFNIAAWRCLSSQNWKQFRKQIQRVNQFQNMYLFQEKIGQGAFSEVYSGVYVPTCQSVAIKVDRAPIHSRKTRHQVAVLRHLNSQGRRKGIPPVYRMEETAQYSYIVMKKLGVSLQNYCEQPTNLTEISTLKSIALQMLNRIEFVHDAGYIHCDIKPSNFVFSSNMRTLYLVDFGLSRRYAGQQQTHSNSIAHGGMFVGTPKFSSVGAHLGIQPSYRDDLQSFCYCLLYMVNGQLPWQHLCSNATSNLNQIRTLKQQLLLFQYADSVSNKILELLRVLKNCVQGDRPNYQVFAQTIESFEQCN